MAVTLGAPLFAPVSGLLLPPGATPPDALSATRTLTPIAATRPLIPVSSGGPVTFVQAHRTLVIGVALGPVVALPLTTLLPLVAKIPFSGWTLLPSHSWPKPPVVIILAVLPTNAPASIILAVSLVAVLGGALVAELSL